MSFRIVGLTPGDVVSAGGNSATYTEPSVQTFSAVAARTAVIEDGSADSIVITEPPARGTLVARDDGFMSFDLNSETDLSDIPFAYEKTTGGVTETVQAVIEVTEPEMIGGWGLPLYYRPEIDGATDNPVVEPGPSSRVLYVSSSEGLTPAYFQTNYGTDGSANDAAVFIINNPQLGYGATPAAAVTQEIAQRFIKRFEGLGYVSLHILFKRGDTFQGADAFGNPIASVAYPGESALHPFVIGAYGTGPLPYWQGRPLRILRGASNVLHTSQGFGRGALSDGLKYICLDNFFCDCAHYEVGDTTSLVFGGANDFAAQHISVRRIKILDTVLTQPGQGRTVWSAQSDRCSNLYGSVFDHLMLEKIFGSNAGWGPQSYRYDLDFAQGSGMGIGNVNHMCYLQSNAHNITAQHIFALEPAFQALQFRSGAIAQNCVGVQAQSGFLFGGGWGQASSAADPNNYSVWSYADQVTQVGAGLKQSVGSPTVVGRGMNVTAPRMPRLRSGIFNSGTRDYFSGTDGSELGPRLDPANNQNMDVQTFGTNGPSGVVGYIDGEDQYAISDWNRDGQVPTADTHADQNVGSVPQAVRDALTPERWLDQKLSLAPDTSTYEDFRTYARDHDTPWSVGDEFNQFVLEPFGWATPVRTAPQDVVFRPNATHRTPGIRADILLDWMTSDLPGTVAGDGINLDGHVVHWNQTPENAIASLTFGEGGVLHMLGGALRPTSVVVGMDGNTLTMDGGSKFDLPGYDGAGALSVTVDESRWQNTGDVTGLVSVTGRYMSEVILAREGGSFTLSGNQLLEVHGFCYAGFDGAVGGAASARLSNGSTTRFKPSLKLPIAGLAQSNIIVGASGDNDLEVRDYFLPQIGSIVSGQTSGATGTVLKILDTEATGSRVVELVIVDITGVFVAGEDLQAAETTVRNKFPQGATVFGQVGAVPEYVLGSISNVTTGLNGFGPDGLTAGPNVSSFVTLEAGAVVEVDTTGLVPGTYPLIDVGTLTDNGATLPPGVAVSGNQLLLTVS